MGRAENRAQRERHMARRARRPDIVSWRESAQRFGHEWDEDFILSRYEKTRKPCSCWACGHYREHNGPTMQERRAELPD